MILAALVALALQTAGPAPASTSAGGLPGATAALLPGAVQLDVTSRITGRTYRIYVAKPLAPPPPGGYPVITVLDGDTAFPTAASQMTLRALSGRTALVVGVAYPERMRTMSLRQRDLTPYQPTDFSDPGQSKDPASYAGADLFYRFLTEELRPMIAAAYRTDPRDETLVGYSLGGLFSLHVLFQHPEAYRTFVAGSPSIWWADKAVLKDEGRFTAKVRTGAVTPRVLITSDGCEQDGRGFELPPSAPRDAILKSIASARMVDNARELAGRLKALPCADGYLVRYAVFEDEGHNSGIPAATSRAVAFALER